MNNLSVSFTIANINHGLEKANGLVSSNKQGLELEFEVAFLGITKSEIKTVQIAYRDLQKIVYDEGWFSDSIILEGNSMTVFKDLPGTEVATCTLTIKKKDRQEAKNLISQAQLRLSEMMLDEMDD